MQIVFIGLGQMGRALVRHLLHHGLEVVGVDPSVSAREACKDIGLPTQASLASLSGQSQYVFACVPTPDDVLQIVDHYLALPAELKPQYFINLSTVGAQTAMQIEQSMAEKCPETVFVECPITGGVLTARRRECTLLCGCRDRILLEPLRPLLEVMAAQVLVFDSVQETSIAKLVNNISVINNAIGTLEALAFGVRSGLKLPKLFEVMQQGTARSYVLSSTLYRPLITGDLETGFALRLALKDMRLVLQHAAQHGWSMPSTAEAVQRLEEGVEAGLGDLVFPAIAILSGLISPEAHQPAE